MEDEARLGVATSLARRGRMAAAREALGMHPGGVVAIGPDEWEGPTGGYLFRNSSCWVDVWLWEGSVEVEVRAHGGPARGVWPRLRVELGDLVLGEMEVAPSGGSADGFSAQVTTGRHALRVSLVEGFWSSQGELRWARLDTVTVRCGKGAR